MAQLRDYIRIIPPVTKALIVINLIVWLFTMAAPASFGNTLVKYCGLHYFSAPDFNPAQLLTYMFMHATSSPAHLFFNMFALWMFGISIEYALGSKRFLFYYISCGLGAALVQEAVWALTWKQSLIHLILSSGFEPAGLDQIISAALAGQPGFEQMHQSIMDFFNYAFVTIGASGAIYGILLAFGMLFPDRPLYIMFIPVPIKAKWMVIGYGVLELLIGMGQAVGQTDGIAHFAHLGGMIFGVFMILYWKKKGNLNNGRFY